MLHTILRVNRVSINLLHGAPTELLRVRRIEKKQLSIEKPISYIRSILLYTFLYLVAIRIQMFMLINWLPPRTFYAQLKSYSDTFRASQKFYILSIEFVFVLFLSLFAASIFLKCSIVFI